MLGSLVLQDTSHFVNRLQHLKYDIVPSKRTLSKAKTVKQASREESFSILMRPVYIACLLLRLICACVATGYIHPDEHFQSTEPMAGFVFGTNVDLPWEWLSQYPGPSRSVVLP